MTRKIVIWISASALFIIGCGGLSLVTAPTPVIEPTWTTDPLPSPTQPATITPIAFPTGTSNVVPSETPLPTFTFTPTVTLEPQWYMQGPDQVIVPILLYHHIGYSLRGDDVYYVSPDTFDQQLNLLYQWGYKTISVELLVKAIKEGAELPPKPILLTFDDGSKTIYENALPMMQRYGFTGASYIVYNYVGIRNYMNADQIRALYTAGWEVGSHGLSHRDLTARRYRQMDEIVESRRRLESLLGVPVLSFAYPFGAYDSDSLHYVHEAGYLAAMGLGNESLQGTKNLFYLYRQAVKGSEDLRTFALHLPWRQDQYDLPALTIVP
ncbi:MAG TPA: polysaccharide deacetylase family protein [Anaerolineales bacterium]|nr:polysaccharide deacetylase family protein [Anaerolineales bacterium]